MTARLSPRNLKAHNCTHPLRPPRPPRSLSQSLSLSPSQSLSPSSQSQPLSLSLSLPHENNIKKTQKKFFSSCDIPEAFLIPLPLASYPPISQTFHCPSSKLHIDLNECLNYLQNTQQDFLPSIVSLMILHLQKQNPFKKCDSIGTRSLLSTSSQSDISTPSSSCCDFFNVLTPLRSFFPTMNYLGVLYSAISGIDAPQKISGMPRHYILIDSYLIECAQLDDGSSLFPIGYCSLDDYQVNFVSSHDLKDSNEISHCSIQLTFNLPSKRSINLSPDSNFEADCRLLHHQFIVHSQNLSLPFFETDSLGTRIKLGTGRYSDIFQSVKVLTPEESEDPEEAKIILPIAIKVFDKELFRQYVKEGSEKGCAVMREVLSLWRLQLHYLAESVSQNNEIPFIQLYGMRETRTHFYVEMERVSPNLLSVVRLSPKHRLTEDHTRHIIYQLIHAIVVLQYCGMAHRDIKLSNIGISEYVTDSNLSLSENKSKSFQSRIKKFLSKGLFSNHNSSGKCSTSRKSIKLLDFGMIGFTDSQGLLAGRCGSLGYIAPEILRGGENDRYTTSCDMFSIGVVMYILLTGYEPFGGDNDDETRERNKSCLIDQTGDEWKKISLDGKLFVCACLNSSPLMRLSPLEALNHPWFASYDQIVSGLSSKKILSL